MQTIELDLAMRRIVPLLHAKQNDVGRRFAAVLTDNSAAYAIPADAVFSVWYSGASGEGNYTTIDGKSAFSVSGNTVTVELILQMLQNKGPGQLCLVMNKADGTQLGLWNIPYFVEEIPGAGSQEATAYYTAFQEAVQGMGAAGIESDAFPGCYYRIVNGETEWLNPPMAVGEEYRTTDRYLGVPVYTMVCDCGAVPEAATEKIVSHGIEGVNLVLRCAGTLSSGNSLPLNREGYGEISVMGTPTEIILRAGANNASLSSWLTAQAQIWYTRH